MEFRLPVTRRSSRDRPRRRTGLLRNAGRSRHAHRSGERGGQPVSGDSRRRCRFKAMRTTRLIAKPKRRAARSRSIRRACLSRLRRSRNRARARQASVTPSPAPLAVGIDGHYAGWTEEEIQDREALNAPVTRHEWDLDNPVSSEEQQMLAAATEIHTRVLALLGGNDIGDATHYRELRRRIHPLLGARRDVLGQSPRTRRIALCDHLDRARQRALLRDDVREPTTPTRFGRPWKRSPSSGCRSR